MNTSDESRIPGGAGGSGGPQSGAAVVEVLMAMAVALLLTVFLMNAMVMLYARSVFQHAADTGARIGARSGGTQTACETRTAQTIADLAGLYSKSTSVQCSRGAQATTAIVTAHLDPLFPEFGPGWDFTVRATSVTEPVP